MLLVDLDGRRIDFRLVHEGDGLNTKSVKDKPASRDGNSVGSADSINIDRPAPRRGSRVAEPLPHGAKSRVGATKSSGKGAAGPKSSRKPKR